MMYVVFFRKVRRFGLCSSARVCDVSDNLSLADSKLFESIQSPSHCLSHILPPEKNLSGLRSRGHCYVLPICYCIIFCKNSFIPRCVFHFFVIESSTSVCDSFLVFFSFLSFSFVFFNICVCHLLLFYYNKEIS